MADLKILGMIFVRHNVSPADEGWENHAAVTRYRRTHANLPPRGLALALLSHITVLQLILVRVGRVTYKTNERLAWATHAEGRPTETDLVIKH